MQLKIPYTSGDLVGTTRSVWIPTKYQFNWSIDLNVEGGAVLAVLVLIVGIEVFFFVVVKALINCPFKIATWSAGFGSSRACLTSLNYLLLTVPRRYFCCGSSMLHVMSVCKWSSAVWSVEYLLPIMLPVLFCFVI